MQVAKQSELQITIEGTVECRFTPNGKKLATWRAMGLKGFYFQMWDKEDTPGIVNSLIDLPADSVIDVRGHSEIQTFKTPREGKSMRYNVFVVTSWKLVETPD